jgi:Uma2 family endonuclease
MHRKMATTYPFSAQLTVEDFLQINFGPDKKAELDNGAIRMMAGGTGAHARVQRNLMGLLFLRLRASGCSPYGSDTGLRAHDLSLRYPDVTVYCGRDTPSNDRLRVFDDPKAVFEVLSEGTTVHDQTVKLDEYKALPSLDIVVFLDPIDEKIRLLRRTGTHSWNDEWLDAGIDLVMPTLDVSLPWTEIFARD